MNTESSSNLNTWTVVSRLLRADFKVANEALKSLYSRYEPPLRRYMRIRIAYDESRRAFDADDLLQEVAMRFVNGELQADNRKNGSFRDCVYRVVKDVLRDALTSQPPMLGMGTDPTDPATIHRSPNELSSTMNRKSKELIDFWRDHVVSLTLKSLRACNNRYYNVLRLKGRSFGSGRQMSIDQWNDFAKKLTAKYGDEIAVPNLRRLYHRSHSRFSQLLIEEVRSTLAEPEDSALESELRKLGLWPHCKSQFLKMKDKANTSV